MTTRLIGELSDEKGVGKAARGQLSRAPESSFARRDWASTLINGFQTMPPVISIT
jgi:hypothetical protein